jgi:hypothetical protein
MRLARIDFARAARWLFFVSAAVLFTALLLAVLIPSLFPR